MQFYNDEKGREDEKLVETKSILLIRPSLEDDSQKVSFTERHPGTAAVCNSRTLAQMHQI